MNQFQIDYLVLIFFKNRGILFLHDLSTKCDRYARSCILSVSNNKSSDNQLSNFSVKYLQSPNVKVPNKTK